jgi:hypothetical protein
MRKAGWAEAALEDYRAIGWIVADAFAQTLRLFMRPRIAADRHLVE